MRGKISSMLFVALTAMVMSWGNAYASPFAYDLKVEGAESASLTFGRFRVDDGVSDAVDQLDCPAPPGVPTRNDDVPEQIPVEGVMNYMYFQGGQGYFNPAASKAVGDAYYRLSVDCKSEATNASTGAARVARTVDMIPPPAAMISMYVAPAIRRSNSAARSPIQIRWVCGSTKPGQSTLPETSISRAARKVARSSAVLPTARMRPSLIASAPSSIRPRSPRRTPR